jgi:hypothetical protein
MRAGVINTGLWGMFAGSRTAERESASAAVRTVAVVKGWNPARFAQDQVRGLVRQVFCSSAAPVRQVVFSATEQGTDVHSICLSTGEMLARETLREVAVIGRARVGDSSGYGSNRSPQLREISTRVQDNLWLVPGYEQDMQGSTVSMHTYLGEIRKQFEYSVVEAAPSGDSNEAAAMAQLADGIILVLSAQRTRRAAAREIRQALAAAQVRLLGAVLSDREFPIPDGIYRRL